MSSAAAIDPERVFSQAVSFEYSGQLLGSHMQSRLFGPGDKKITPTIVAFFVVRAFTVELYLKCLLCLGGSKIPKEHRLTVLFNLLPQPRKDRISQLHDDLVSRDHVDQYVAKQHGIGISLVDVLATSDDAFRQWRYYFEGNWTSGSGSGLGKVCRALQNTILETRPDWKVISDSLGTLPTFQAQ